MNIIGIIIGIDNMYNVSIVVNKQKIMILIFETSFD